MPKYTAYHADMLAFHLKDNNLLIDKSQIELKDKLELTGIDAIYSENKPSSQYPNDILLNAALLGNNLFCKKENISRKIILFAEQNNKRIINVKQGYTKCSITVVDENAIITTDINIKSCALKNGIDALLITNEGILIDGYNYGFIGGCCGKLDKNVIAFTGNINLHKDYENIKSFCKNYNVDVLSLTNDVLVDIGGILPIIEI